MYVHEVLSILYSYLLNKNGQVFMDMQIVHILEYRLAGVLHGKNPKEITWHSSKHFFFFTKTTQIVSLYTHVKQIRSRL